MNTTHTFLFTTAQATYRIASDSVPTCDHLIQALVTESWIQATLDDCEQVLHVIPPGLLVEFDAPI